MNKQGKGAAVSRWLQVVEAMKHPHFQLDAEEFALLYESYSRARAVAPNEDWVGEVVHVLMEVLRRQIINSSADGDSDGSDEMLDREDPDADGWADAKPLWDDIQYRKQIAKLRKGGMQPCNSQ